MSARYINFVIFAMETRTFQRIEKGRRRSLNWGREPKSLIGRLARAGESRGGTYWLLCQAVRGTAPLRNTGPFNWMFYSIFDFTFARHAGLSDRLFFLLDVKVGFFLLFALVVVTKRKTRSKKINCITNPMCACADLLLALLFVLS